MIEYIMRFDEDDSGKLINAKRMEHVVRCKDCPRVSKDVLFDMWWCNGHIVKPDGFCDKWNMVEDSDDT